MQFYFLTLRESEEYMWVAWACVFKSEREREYFHIMRGMIFIQTNLNLKLEGIEGHWRYKNDVYGNNILKLKLRQKGIVHVIIIIITIEYKRPCKTYYTWGSSSSTSITCIVYFEWCK